MSKEYSTAFAEWVAKEVEDLGGEYTEPTEDEIPAAPDRPDYTTRQKSIVCGVYFLISEGEVLYVGQSRNFYARLSQHMTNAPFEFDSFLTTECHPHHLNALEAKFIHELQPRWNKEIPSHNGSKHYCKSFTK